MYIATSGIGTARTCWLRPQMAAKIAELLRRRALTQARAAEILGLNAADSFRPLEGAVSWDFRAPFAGMPDPIGPGCPHCDQADAQESVERPVNAFGSIGPAEHTGGLPG